MNEWINSENLAFFLNALYNGERMKVKWFDKIVENNKKDLLNFLYHEFREETLNYIKNINERELKEEYSEKIAKILAEQCNEPLKLLLF